MEGKRMQKWSQSITEQWKNLGRVMEKERECKDKIKGTDWGFGAGCTMGRRLEGQERGLGGLFGALWGGLFGWLLGSKGAHIVKVANGC